MTMPKIFLEDIGTLKGSTEGKNIWEIKNISQTDLFKKRSLPENIYIVDFPGRGIGQEFLLGRHICGPQKFLMIKTIGHDMIRLFKDHFTGRPAQFVILWGGRPLDLLAADPPLYGDHLVDTSYIKLTRVEDPSSDRGWKIIKSSFVGEWWKNDTWIIMEECIASGKTLKHFVEEAFSHHRPKKLFIFPVCASAEGLEGINSVCEENGVEFVPVLNCALIQVAEKGINKPFTDLGLQPKTIVSKIFFDALKERYQGTPLCWVGDIGDSLYKTHDYLLDTISDMLKTGMDLSKENLSRWNPTVFSGEFIAKLKTHDPLTYDKVKRIFSSVPR